MTRGPAPSSLRLGLPQPMTARARRFRNQLEGRYRLPVHLVDERYTTREARERAARPGRKDDAVAARVILEDYLGHG